MLTWMVVDVVVGWERHWGHQLGHLYIAYSCSLVSSQCGCLRRVGLFMWGLRTPGRTVVVNKVGGVAFPFLTKSQESHITFTVFCGVQVSDRPASVQGESIEIQRFDTQSIKKGVAIKNKTSTMTSIFFSSICVNRPHNGETFCWSFPRLSDILQGMSHWGTTCSV